ncbi:MAG: hypothetical protein WEE64_10275 [Dehalococcoidia bacterium]
MAIHIAIYCVVTIVVAVTAAWRIWRLAAASSNRQERWALRGGVVMGIVTIGTIGNVEAAFLGFHPVALIPTTVFGALGFGLGAIVGVLGAFVFRR